MHIKDVCVQPTIPQDSQFIPLLLHFYQGSSAKSLMASTRLAVIVAIALAASQSAYAATAAARPVTCSTGHVTANAACCGVFDVIILQRQKSYFRDTSPLPCR